MKEQISESMLQSASENVSFSKEFPTTTALAGASVAVTYWSTTALEAVLLGTPLVQVNATGLPDFFNISEHLGLGVARDSEGLRELIRGAISKPKQFRERFLGELGLRLDGKAATRVALEVSALFVPSEDPESPAEDRSRSLRVQARVTTPSS